MPITSTTQPILVGRLPGPRDILIEVGNTGDTKERHSPDCTECWQPGIGRTHQLNHKTNKWVRNESPEKENFHVLRSEAGAKLERGPN